MPAKRSTTKPPAKSGSAMRTIAPLAPLAVALIGGAMTAPRSTTAAPAPTLPKTAVTRTISAPPAPLLRAGSPVDWWFVFKFNAGSFPDCGNGVERVCPFGGTVKPYHHFSQQFAYASSADAALQKGGGCIGDSKTDPVGATYDQIYNGRYSYVVWNDQFYGDPIDSEASPAGHSKGMLAWDADGNGVVMQVSTPSWPGSGSAENPRKTDGNTLGCIEDNDVLVSQHFFGLKLTREDTIAVLKGLANASVVTDTSSPQIVNNGGPAEIQTLVRTLGHNSTSTTAVEATLSTGVKLISKPSRMHVPAWQMVSAILGGEPLRAATWWTRPEIPSTDGKSVPECWDSTLSKPGAVEIATSGTWAGTTFGLEGQAEPDGNHAKIGVSTGTHPYAIFGDLNQQGALSGNCKSSQNGRGGLFYVVESKTLADSVRALITAPKS